MTEGFAIPGKLMVAGEYAVLRPDGVCLAAAVGELVRVTLGADGCDLQVQAFGQATDCGLHTPCTEGLAGFAWRALAWLDDAHGLRLQRNATLAVGGAIGGAKVGLGTSAAVTVATLRAVLASRGLAWPPEQVAAAARTIHASGQGAGSGYDVSAIAYGGCIQYARSPDRATPLPWPAGVFAAALFCGEPAPTQAALQAPAIASGHLDAMAAATRLLLTAWREPPSAVLAAVAACDSAFLAAAADAPALLSPAILAVRARIAEYACLPRASGAGGGDCVLAFSADRSRLARLVTSWREAGGHVVAELPGDVAAPLAPAGADAHESA